MLGSGRSVRRVRGRVPLAIMLLIGVLVGPSALIAHASTSDGTSTATIADANSAQDAASASAIARAYNHPVVVTSEMTETEQVSAMPDGTMYLQETSDPTRVLRNGAWTPIDLTLSVGSDGMLAPAAAPVPVEFSNGGTGALARVLSASGTWLSESWTSGALPQPTVSGSAATYPSVYPGVDLRLSATAGGMSEVLVVKSATAAANPQLSSVAFGVSGATLSAVSGTGGAPAGTSGSAAASASDGLVTPSPVWWDSGATGSGPAGPGSSAETRPVADSVSGSQITVNAAAAAQKPGLIYPVYVDPVWTGTTVSRTFVDQTYPTQSYWNDGAGTDGLQHVGYIDAAHNTNPGDDGLAHLTRSIWQMDTSKIWGKHILSAALDTYEVWSSSCNATEVDLWATGGISASTTWNAQPTWGGKLSSQTVAYGYSSSCPANAVGFDATSAVVNAAKYDNASIGLGLKAANEGDWLSWKKFGTSPVLGITYNSIPGTPNTLKVTPCPFVCADPAVVNGGTANTITVQGQSVDADGGNLNYHFELWRYGESTPIATANIDNVPSGPGHIAYWKIPVAIPDSTLYQYRVSASDGIDTSPTAVFHFTSDSTPPPAPKLSFTGSVSGDPNSRAGVVGVSSEQMTITPNPGDDAWGYAYAILPTGATPVYPSNLTCGSSARGYVTVCPGSLNAPVTVDVVMPEANSTFSAVTFDAAGNTQSAPAAQAFYANGDYSGDSYSSALGHSWLTDSGTATQPACQQLPVPDSAANGPQPSSALSLASYSGIIPCWTRDSGAPGLSGSVLTVPGPTGNGVLQFNGANAALTASPVLDTTKSFTVAGWFEPSATLGAGQVQTALAQDAANTSTFLLQNNAGHWSFCLPNSDSATFVGDCVTSTATVTGNTWWFVAAEYVADDHELLLYVSPGSASIPTALVGSHGANPASSGALAVGRGRYGSSTQYWAGEVLDPVAMQGVADVSQLGKLAVLTPPWNVQP